MREVESFVGDADAHDDMTMILLKVEETARRCRRCEHGRKLAMSDTVVIFKTHSESRRTSSRGCSTRTRFPR